MSKEMHAMHKELSLISLVPKWSSAENANPIEEFLASIDKAALIGRWLDTDCFKIAFLRLADPAEALYNAWTELHMKTRYGRISRTTLKKDLGTYTVTSITL